MSIMIFMMCGICILSATIGVTSAIHQEARNRKTLYFTLLCIVNAILSFAYANVMDNDSHAAVVAYRYFIVAGLVLSMQITLYLILELAEKRSMKVKVLAGLLMVYGIIVIFAASTGDNVRLLNSSTYSISYVLNHSWGIYLESLYILLVTILALYVLYGRWKTATFKRVKLQAGIYAIAFALLSLSIQMVVLIPLAGIAMPPLSSVFIFMFIVFVQQISSRYKTFNITFENISGLIYHDVMIPILVTDFHDQIILANEVTFSYFNLTKAELYNATIDRLFAEDFAGREEEPGHISLNDKFETSTFDGSHSVLVEKTNYNDTYGDLICSIYMVQDISESKQLIQRLNDSIVEAEIANKAKSSFLANMSHEIRTPMNAIVGMAEIALQMDLPPEIAANMNSIRSAGLGLVTIINDILDFSKIESGKMEIVESEYILSSIIVDIVNMFAIRMANTDVLLLVDVNPRIPMYLIGDEIRIKQILVNIIGNAVKFTKKGYVKLEIDGAFDDDAESYSLVFNVIDTGIGIKEEDLPKLFGMFSQVDTKKNRNIKGTGLGLSIARNLSQMMGGDRAFETDNGYAVASRQNKPQAAGNRPFLQQGMLRGRAVGYSTDAMQFFGLAYKAGAPAKGLWRDLDNVNYQFELSYIALQSERFSLAAHRCLAFYGVFHRDHPEVLTTSPDTAPLEEAFRRAEASAMRWAEVPLRTPRRKGRFGGLFTSPEMSEEQIERLWPTRHLEEWGEKGERWSLFTPGHTHVVLQAKELSCVRPHAHIIMSAPDTQEVRDSCMATTNTMYGVFNAQTVIGNTSMNRLISVHRGLLNQLKNHGQRLWVEIDGQYRLLGLPATYEMGLNWARWRYVLPDGDQLVVSEFAAAHSAGIVLEVRCKKERDMLLSTQLVMGNEHPPNAVETQWHGRVLRIRQPEHMRADSPYPGLHYDLHFQEIPDESGDDGVFFEDGVGCNHTLLTCTFRMRTGFTLTIVGAFEDAPPATEAAFDFHAERKAWEKVHSDFTVGLRIGATQPSMLRKAQLLDHTAWWFAHNALVHFASPHGLEQTNGAAWGTRDVCQGPFEFFMSTGHFTLVRSLLLRVFAHQLHETGEWPQWSMFDRYAGHAPECHGDVVFWPLKCLAAYITATGDEDILLSSVPWQGSSARAPLADHLGKALAAIETRFFPGTWLISYAGGDWNDTLQPANVELRRELVSSWTQALAAETMRLLADALSQRLPGLAGRCRLYAKGMADDFTNRLINDGVVMGLARVRADGRMIPLLHPRDTETGICYRLLPHIQSILSGIVTREQEAANLDIIKEHLLFPDGVRLMDRPVRYTGGNSHLFQRAEQDANVGRESGLMYTHAHIRYIEALMKSGHSDLAWEALFYVVPSAMREIVPSAAPRQSNVYFSSSDALFLDRFDFQERYTLLKDGWISLLGGWRLYSSGPGLWFALLLRDILGIRIKPECVTASDRSNCGTAGLEISLCHSDEEYRITL